MSECSAAHPMNVHTMNSRLFPLSGDHGNDKCPKALLPIANKPMVSYTLAWLEESHIRGKFALSTAFSKLIRTQMSFSYAQRPTDLPYRTTFTPIHLFPPSPLISSHMMNPKISTSGRVLFSANFLLAYQTILSCCLVTSFHRLLFHCHHFSINSEQIPSLMVPLLQRVGSKASVRGKECKWMNGAMLRLPLLSSGTNRPGL